MFGNRSGSFPLFNNYFFLQIEGLALYRVENVTTIIVEKISQQINGDLKSKSKCFRSGIFKIVVLQTSQTLDNSESSQELTVFFFNFRIASWIAGSLIQGLLDFGIFTEIERQERVFAESRFRCLKDVKCMVTVFLIGLVAITPSRAQFTGKATFLLIFLAYISR